MRHVGTVCFYFHDSVHSGHGWYQECDKTPLKIDWKFQTQALFWVFMKR